VKADADGTFSLRVRPAVQTQYTATSGSAKSNAVPVHVRPLVRLKHPTMTSRAVFHTRLAVKIRVVIPRSQARPGYIAGSSNSVRG
jgi:hypothetical protein